MNIIRRRQKLIEELRDKKYRDAFVSAQVDIGMPFQIRVLREKKGWTQKELADRAGMKQAWISRIENPGYSGFSLRTLKKLASVFDVGLVVRCIPISQLVEWELNLSNNSLMVLSFDEESYFDKFCGDRDAINELSNSKTNDASNILLFTAHKSKIMEDAIGQQRPQGVSVLTETPYNDEQSRWAGVVN